MIKLPPVDRIKLEASYRCKAEADDLRRKADDLERRAQRLRREHYDEQYDRCRGCDGHGIIGEGLGVHTCPHCNCGLLPKGTLSAL